MQFRLGLRRMAQPRPSSPVLICADPADDPLRICAMCWFFISDKEEAQLIDGTAGLAEILNGSSSVEKQ